MVSPMPKTVSQFRSPSMTFRVTGTVLRKRIVVQSESD